MRKSLLLTTALTLAGAGFDSARWQYRTRFQLNPGSMTALRLSPDIYAHSHFSDLRVVRGSTEVPYILETRSGSIVERELPARMLDKAVSGSALQLTLDLGRRIQTSRLRFATGEKNFKHAVRIETSDDNRSWTMARAAGYIFEVSEDDVHASVLRVDYPTSTRRYIRATIEGFLSPGAITGAWAMFREETPAEWDTVATVNLQQSEDGKISVGDLHLSAETLHERIRIEVSTPVFYRRADVSSLREQRSQFHGMGIIHRVPGEETLAIEYGPRRDRDLRLRIHNGDDPPLQLIRAYLEVRRRIVKLPPSPEGDYWIYYGNPGAAAPQYDLAATMRERDPAAVQTIQLTAGEPNPAYTPPPTPLSDRFPNLLNGALVAAVLGMGVLTLRLMKKVRNS